MGLFLKNRYLFLFGLLYFSPPVLWAQDKTGKEEAPTEVSSTGQPVSKLPVLTYSYELKGLKETDVPGEFESKSNLILLKKRPLYSSFALSKRAQDDLEMLQKVLYSFGYYDASTSLDINDSSKKDISRHIIFSVTTGERYKVKTVKARFEPLGKGPAPCQKDLEELGIHIEETFTAEKVLSAFDKFKDHLANCGYPFAKIKGHEAIISRPDKTVNLVLKINPGPYVKFGIIRLKSSGVVPDTYVKNRAPFKEGEPYDQRKVDAYQDKLSTTKLFNKIQIQREKKAEDTEDGDDMPMNVDLSDAKPRTVSAGVKFGTSVGIGTKLSWIHRNITGNADKFMASAEQSQRLSLVGLDYQLPDFLKVDQTLVTTVEYKEERTRAYGSRGYGIAAILKNELAEGWSYSYGLMVESVRLSQYSSIIHVDGVGVPLGFTINTQDDDLEPSSGGKLVIDVTPEYGHLGKTNFITRTQVHGAYHIPMDKHHRNVLALWSRLGMLFGGSVNDMPGDRRFFSGGGGSIRGYGYQLAGPIDGEGKPLGGKSLFEFGIEPRLRFGDSWGAVVFFEGGLISDTTHPTFKNRLFLGLGTGIRYYTSFGPIRADIAIPLRKRRKDSGKVVDRAFQIYISIGQAF